MKKLILILCFLLMATPCFAAKSYYWIRPVGVNNALHASASTALAGCKTVDTTPPADSIDNYCTWDKANGTGVAAGDTVYYRAGTYTITATGGVIVPFRSGTSVSAPTTFASYSNEVVNFVASGSDQPALLGIQIIGMNYIKVTGYDGSTSARNMKFSNFARFLQIFDASGSADERNWGGATSSYNEISYCDFSQTNDTWIIRNDIGNGASNITAGSTYNWIHHNTFSKMGGYTAGDISSALDLGWEDCGLYTSSVCTNDTSYNVIEDNIMYHAGHQILGLFNHHNVVRNNTFHNEQWYQYPVDSVWYGYRIIQTQSTFNADGHHAYNLIEGNRLSHATNNPNASLGGEALHLAINNTIVRHNDFYANSGNPIYMEAHTLSTTARVNYNHIYNNTFFANGYGALFPNSICSLTPGGCNTGTCGGTCNTQGSPPDRSTIYFVSAEATFPTKMYGNVVKNNLSWRDYTTSNAGFWTVRAYDSTDGWKDMTSATCGGAICGDTIVSNNWLHTNGDPKFTDEGSYSIPEIHTTDVEWYWGASTPDGTSITSKSGQIEPVFTLKSSSPAINTGTWLTQANNSGSNTTALSVDDASYFQPGWGKWSSGGPSMAADYICFSSSATATDLSRCVQISSIDYTNHDITLASNMTWADNDYIWLYKNSSGTIVLAGTLPDQGAHEYGVGTPPSAQGCEISGGTFK